MINEPMRATIERLVYSSNSVNSSTRCVSWGPLLACGMSQSLVLIDQSASRAQIVREFHVHSSSVTCVCWAAESLLVSADEHGTLVLYRLDPSTRSLISSHSHRVPQFSSVVALSATSLRSHVFIVCASETQMKLIRFSLSNETFTEIDSINFKPCFALSVNIIGLEEALVMSAGLDNGRVMCSVCALDSCCEDNGAETSSGSPADSSCTCDNDNRKKVLRESIVLSGHDDWITSLDAIKYGSDIYLASSSQDCFIRVWKMSLKSEFVKESQLDIYKLRVPGTGNEFYVTLDGVLAGHENWVTSVRFRDTINGLNLMTTSMDKTVILWGQNEEDGSGQWMEEMRLGQIGGNSLGFIGGDMNSTGRMIVGFGYQGNMTVWSWNEELEKWETVVNVGGHFDFVEDLSWENDNGRYLITVSKDQTTRLHGQWLNKSDSDVNQEWYELGRPQIHGFDMTCVASIDSTTFITGAEEKISRVFGMNKEFSNYLQRINSSMDLSENKNVRNEIVSTDALGLSNKSETVINGDQIEPVIISAVPKEDNNSGKTLWPEITKLYGHVYEVFRISCHKEKKIVATTCKSASADYSDIILWNTDSWTILQRLFFHKLTVARVQFNNRGDKMVSVSKDRQWALWADTNHSHSLSEPATLPNFTLVGQSGKTKLITKIIWDVDWTPDDMYFVTASRDKRVILWSSDECAQHGDPLILSDSVNAISTMPALFDNVYTFAAGLESGIIKIIQFDKTLTQWSILHSFKAHYNWITRLKFCPKHVDNKFMLASSSKDRFVKIYEIEIPK